MVIYVYKITLLIIVSTLLTSCGCTREYSKYRERKFGVGGEISHSEKINIKLYKESDFYYLDWICSGKTDQVMVFEKSIGVDGFWLCDIKKLPANAKPVHYTNLEFNDYILMTIIFKENGKSPVTLYSHLDDQRVPWIFRNKSLYNCTKIYYAGTAVADVATFPFVVIVALFLISTGFHG